MKSIITICLFLLFSIAAVPSSAQTAAAKASFNKVIDAYLGVKDALVMSNGPEASKKATVLLDAIAAVHVAELSPDQQKTWQSLEAKLTFDSRHISEVEKVPHQREHFASLSKNFYTVLKGIPLNKGVLYAEICTMTKNGFLSQSATGKDPYMGMDNCSKVTATLPARH